MKFSTKPSELSKGSLRRFSSRKLGFPVAQTPNEVAVLGKYARRVKKPLCIIEIGTRNGGSALVLAMGTMVNVITIDILPDPRLTAEECARFGYKQVKVPLKKHWARYPGGSRIEQVTAKSWEYEHDGRPVGLVFIDGGHEYDEVRQDWLHFVPMIEPGGYVLLHDYEQFPGVTKFVQEDISYPILEQADSIVVYQIPEEEDDGTDSDEESERGDGAD